MPEGSKVFNRMADVVFALSEAERTRVRPTRIQLQKFIYLTDALGQIAGVFKPLEGHKTYRNGPYDFSIQNAVDALSFRGISRVAGTWRTPSGHLGTSYALTVVGRQFVRILQNQQPLARRVEIARLVGHEIRTFGWDRIVGLVYAEPTYVASRPSGWGIQLDVDNGLEISSAFLISIMRRVALTINTAKEPTLSWISERFFAYLNDYDLKNG